jgi:hypothetical protein
VGAGATAIEDGHDERVHVGRTPRNSSRGCIPSQSGTTDVDPVEGSVDQCMISDRSIPDSERDQRTRRGSCVHEG